MQRCHEGIRLSTLLEISGGCAEEIFGHEHPCPCPRPFPLLPEGVFPKTATFFCSFRRDPLEGWVPPPMEAQILGLVSYLSKAFVSAAPWISQNFSTFQTMSSDLYKEEAWLDFFSGASHLKKSHGFGLRRSTSIGKLPCVYAV